MPRPDGRSEKLGLVVLDEPATEQSEPDELMQRLGDAAQAGSLPAARTGLGSLDLSMGSTLSLVWLVFVFGWLYSKDFPSPFPPVSLPAFSPQLSPPPPYSDSSRPPVSVSGRSHRHPKSQPNQSRRTSPLSREKWGPRWLEEGGLWWEGLAWGFGGKGERKFGK